LPLWVEGWGCGGMRREMANLLLKLVLIMRLNPDSLIDWPGQNIHYDFI